MTTRFENRRVRMLGAAALLLITMGLVQASNTRSGAGTPCGTCTARCFSYSIGHFSTQGGCKEPNGSVDWNCMTTDCMTGTGWCTSCITELPGVYIDCGHPNCAFGDIIALNGGNICDNACFGAQCSAAGWFTSAKSCCQVQIIDCEPEQNSSIGCSQCGCR